MRDELRLNIYRIHYPVHALGPGNRLGIWVQGCARRCPGCMSTEMQPKSGGMQGVRASAACSMLEQIFRTHGAQGVTVSGGEPLDQAEAVAALLERMREHTNDILLYTGYPRSKVMETPRFQQAAALAGVVVYGPYIAALNDGRALRGSSNQEIVFNDETLKERYAPLLSGPRRVQAVRSGENAFLIGILG